MTEYPPVALNSGVGRSTHRLYAELDESLKWSCGFGEYPTDPPCMAPAVWHGFVIHQDAILAMMACCDQHRAAMSRSAHYVHELDAPCALPGSMFFWPENFCATPDPDASELLEAAKAVSS
jgi:hypothetical protein